MDSPTPSCDTCGYSLIGLTEYRCPECGTPFTEQDLERAATIQLLWNRHDKPLLVRLIKTILLAWFKPHVYFSTAAKNPTRPLRTPGRFIFACIALSIGLHLCIFIVSRAVRFITAMADGVTLKQYIAYVIHARAPQDFFSMQAAFFAIDMALSVIVITGIMWLFRNRKKALSIGHIAALLMPALPLQSLLLVIAYALPFITELFVINLAPIWLPLLFLLISSWLCSRLILQLNRLRRCTVIIIAIPSILSSFSILNWIYYGIFLSLLGWWP